MKPRIARRTWIQDMVCERPPAASRRSPFVRVITHLTDHAGDRFRSREFPPWPRRGGRDIKQNAAKPPLLKRTGWFVLLPTIGGLTNHPVCAV